MRSFWYCGSQHLDWKTKAVGGCLWEHHWLSFGKEFLCVAWQLHVWNCCSFLGCAPRFCLGSYCILLFFVVLYMLPLSHAISKSKGISYHWYADDIQLYVAFKLDKTGKLIVLSDSRWDRGPCHCFRQQSFQGCSVFWIPVFSYTVLSQKSLCYIMKSLTHTVSFASQPELQMIIHTFIDYCNSLFAWLSKSSPGCIQMVQNTAATPILYP